MFTLTSQTLHPADIIIHCVLKKVSTLENRLVCPSGRLHVNFWKTHPIVTKFCIHLNKTKLSIN